MSMGVRKAWLLGIGVTVITFTGTADTIYLNTGVPVEGIATTRPDGMIEVQAGERKVVFRPDEVESIEKNDKTGRFDMEAAQAEWAERDRELTEATGLTAEQRAKVEALLYDLQREDRAERARARDQLKALQEKMDVYRYIAYLYPGLSHRLAPWVLEAMYALDPARAVPVIRGEIDDTYYETRAMAITLSAVLEDQSAVPAIMRGLVDHKSEVQTQAALALAHLRAREATPALVALLQGPDPGVRTNVENALKAMWSSALSDPAPHGYDAWQEFWKSQEGQVGGAVTLASLEPLIQPEDEFQDE
jgi:hypothetical protein